MTVGPLLGLLAALAGPADEPGDSLRPRPTAHAARHRPRPPAACWP
ncbi:MAG: hypothetical protein H0V43_01310 [Gemmatimonadales bacterium]|nr:hypothetical protein [Gemmatimonadales bacterium]